MRCGFFPRSFRTWWGSAEMPLFPLDPPPATAAPPLNRRLFRRRLIEARLRKGWRTREYAAARLGVDVESLRAYEKGKYLPNFETVFQMAELLGVSLDWLAGRSKPEH